MRYFLELSYFGKAYHGWQKQPNALSVQEVVENSLSVLFQIPIEIVGAGRTDTGVHARQIFAHFDIEEKLSSDFIFRMNSLLPKDIAVLGIHSVQSEAHARFDAVSRSYEYFITNQKNVFAVDTAYHVQKSLDLNKMNEAAAILLDYQNFKSFSRSRTDVRTYNCKIMNAVWKRTNEGLVFRIEADRFLRNMVRAIVGTIIDVGIGKNDVQAMHKIIKIQDRAEAGASAPAHGLFLSKIEYPKSIFN